MEYMEKGSLTAIVGKDIDFPEPCIAYVCKGILKALAVLHEDNRIHRGLCFADWMIGQILRVIIS